MVEKMTKHFETLKTEPKIPVSSSTVVSGPRTPLFKPMTIKDFKLGPKNNEFIDSLVEKLKTLNIEKIIDKVNILTEDKNLSYLENSLKVLEGEGVNKVTFNKKSYPNIHYKSLL